LVRRPRETFDQIRARHLKIVVLCWFVDGFIGRHPEYAALRAG